MLCLEPLGLSVTGASKTLGVGSKTLSAILNGRGGVSPEMAVRLTIEAISNRLMSTGNCGAPGRIRTRDPLRGQASLFCRWLFRLFFSDSGTQRPMRLTEDLDGIHHVNTPH